MNKVIMTGNLVRDPERGTTPNGVNYTRFTIAVKRRYKRGDQDSIFVRVTAWRALGDTCAQYLSKGRKVGVVGEIDVSAYNGRDGTARASLELDADEVEFLSPKGQTGEAAEAPPQETGTFTRVDNDEAQGVFDEEAPF